MTTSDDPEFKEPQTPQEAQAAFEHLFDEIIDLLQITTENIDQSPNAVPEGLEAKIAKLEAEVALFQKIGQATSSNRDAEDQKNHKLTKREQASIERGEKAIKNAEDAIEKLPKVPPIAPKDISNDKDRRKHFKRLGRKKI